MEKRELMGIDAAALEFQEAQVFDKQSINDLHFNDMNFKFRLLHSPTSGKSGTSRQHLALNLSVII
jgi:hypothetical protein